MNEIKAFIDKNKSKFEQFEEETKKNRQIAIWGAGLWGQFSSEYLIKNGYNVTAFIDSNPAKQGIYENNIEIVAPDSEKLKNCDGILISARHCVNEILNSIDSNSQLYQTPILAFDVWYITKNYEKILNLIDIFEDDESRRVIKFILLAKLTGNEKYYSEITNENQYFCIPEFIYGQNETFIDVGAYVGDTLENFIYKHNGYYEKIYAFEPGKEAYNALKTRCKRLTSEWAKPKDSIILINSAVGEREKSANFTKNNGWAQGFFLSNSKGDTVKVYPIDKFNIESTFIKADIEGMELSFLEGAKNTITKNKPKLAICAYHKPNDIIEIINYIKQIVPEYKVAIRHHSYISEETVLYFWL